MLVKAPRKIQQWKVEEVRELARLFKEYRTFAIADITGFPTNQIQKLRKKLDGKAVLRVAKLSLVKLAMEEVGIDHGKFEGELTGQKLLIFTNLNAFELAQELEKHKSLTYYKPGDVAETEIVIPEGNTGLQPGPILSVFGRLKVQTKVVGNAIHVAKDTVVAKPGDVVSEDLASILQKLGLPLKEAKLKVRLAYEDGIVIPGESLKINVDHYVDLLKQAALDAMKLGSEIAWPEKELIELALLKASLHARALAVETCLVAPDTIELLLRVAQAKANALAVALADKVPGIVDVKAAPVAQAQAAPAQQPAGAKEEKKEEAEEKEGVSEEQLAEGLGALFG
ncbi:MAG: 50S ribosomal protein L10, partial [Desulfurococcaceae archaeon]